VNEEALAHWGAVAPNKEESFEEYLMETEGSFFFTEKSKPASHPDQN
jgi:hypothetical protein